MAEIKVRTKWDRKKLQTKITGPSKVQQNLKDRTDINLIMQKYQKTGLIDHVKDPNKADYGDFSEVQDYQSALNQVMEAQEAFMTLSAKVRKRFDNDPAQFISFMEDPSNEKEAQDLGLITKVVEPVLPPTPQAEPEEKPGA